MDMSYVNQKGCENPCFEGECGGVTRNVGTYSSFVPEGGDANVRKGNTEGDPEKKDVNDDDGRDTWGKPIEFLLSCISMSVGLGNVWRFPGIAAQNGGGAFLIPYFCVLLCIGRPLYYLEMCLGQFSRSGQVKVWNMSPILKGVGYGSLVALICCCSYYGALMAITFHYFFASFSTELPWAVCDEEVYGNETCSLRQVKGELAQLYYDKIVFPQLENVNNGLGKLHWKLALCLVLSWIIIFFTLVKGVRSSGKVAYFTAFFPYVVLFILLIRGVTLKGAGAGLLYFITPQWERLQEPKVWYAAVEQCLFSLGPGFGCIIMLSSYNSFNRNVYKDALIISFMDTFTSFLAGCTVFSVMGYLVTISREEYGIPLNFTDIRGGTTLAFVLYPQDITAFDWVPQLFAILFMLMLLTLAVGSVTNLVGGAITIICDQFPKWQKWMVTLAVCALIGISGLLFVTEGGLFMLDLVDHFGAGFIVYIMAMLECAGVAYVYGLRNFCDDLEFMLGRKVGIYWKVCWGAVIPVGLFLNLVYYLVTEPEFKSNGIPYPKYATIGGWLLTAFAVALLPACAMHAIASMKGENLYQKFLQSMRPTGEWGPQQLSVRQKWLQFKYHAVNSRGNKGK